MISRKGIFKLLSSVIAIILMQVILGIFAYPVASLGTAGLDWESTNPEMTRLREIARNDKGTYVVVGNDGLVRTSNDLKKWVDQYAGTVETLFDCTWGNGKFVAVGTQGTIIYSGNGTEWKTAKFNRPISFDSITFGNGKFIALGSSSIDGPGYNRLIVSSVDGIHWTVIKEDTGSYLYKITYLNECYIAFGFDELEISSDGVDWTVINLKGDDTFNDITWDGSRFIAVGMSAIWTSADGFNWVPVQHNIGKDLFIDNILYFKDVYYATVSHDDMMYLMSSQDLHHWELVRLKGFKEICSIIIDQNRLVGVGWDDSTIVSDNGTDWQEQKGVASQFLKVVWNGSAFLAIGNDGVIIRSVNGSNWMQLKTNINQDLADVIWTGKEFVALAYSYEYAPETFGKADNYLYKSSDGINWTLIGSIEQRKIRHLFYFNNCYFAIGPFGQILSSVDGQHWRISSSGTSEELTSLTWNGSKYVCVGTNGIVLSSSDGTNWTKSYISGGSNLNQVIWNGNMFVAVGNDENIIRSNDGSIWVLSPVKQDGYDLIDTLWDGQRFILLHRQGEVQASSDFNAIVKLSDHSNNYQPLNMTWNGERYVMVGRLGSTATCLPTDIVKIKVNGIPIPLDVAPKIIKGRTMIPARVVMEKLGATVSWDAKSETVKVIKDGIDISLTINKQTALVNGKKILLDSPATIVRGRTLIPVRFVSESLGANVIWEANTQTVMIENV